MSLRRRAFLSATKPHSTRYEAKRRSNRHRVDLFPRPSFFWSDCDRARASSPWSRGAVSSHMVSVCRFAVVFCLIFGRRVSLEAWSFLFFGRRVVAREFDRFEVGRGHLPRIPQAPQANRTHDTCLLDFGCWRIGLDLRARARFVCVLRECVCSNVRARLTPCLFLES
jgi:hypothetical protein